MLLFSMFRRVSKNLKKNKGDNIHKHMNKQINLVIKQRLSDYKKENKTKKDEINKQKTFVYNLFYLYNYTFMSFVAWPADQRIKGS